jgi:hypothetical protein
VFTLLKQKLLSLGTLFEKIGGDPKEPASYEDMHAGLLQEILANAERVVPLWCAALREWGGWPAPQKPETAMPPEMERELILKMKAEYYAKWPDEPLPALEGKTPHEAVRSASGRKTVEDLLRMMENGDERALKRGDAASDFTAVRQALGLETRR